QAAELAQRNASGPDFWHITVTIAPGTPDAAVWFAGGTLAPGAPRALALILEEENPALAEQIGLELLRLSLPAP
ncbi:MAG: hypothetical protein ACKOC5_07140, partial [Chloroflexota bacterium]